MQELTDDQLDGLFRKSAEEFDPPYDPAAWETIKEQLDDRDRTAFWRKWLPWGLPLLLLLLMSGIWYTYHQTRPEPEKKTAPVATAAPASVGKKESRPREVLRSGTEEWGNSPKAASTKPLSEPGSGLETKMEMPGQVEKPAGHNESDYNAETIVGRPEHESGPTANKPVLITRDFATKAALTAYRKKVSKAHRSRNVQLTSQPGGSREAVDYVVRQNRIVGRRKLERGINTDIPSPTFKTSTLSGTPHTQSMLPSFTERPSGNQTDDIPAVADRNWLPTMTTLAIRPAKWSKMTGLENREVREPARSESVSIPNTTSAVQRGFSVRLAVAPDLSAIGLQNFTRPGTNLGALIEYRLASRWSFQTGVIWSMKLYKASSEQYDATADYWKKFPKRPETISGQCSMIDIPINVRYDVVVRPRFDNRLQPSRWFASGGVTSYVTLREDYSYEYPAHTYGVKEWRAPSGSYGFSQLNLSVGYERALSRRLSWQVEPFLKAPLKGVGFFKMDLLSTGAFLSIRYKL